MEINNASQPSFTLASDLQQGDAFGNGTVTGTGTSGSATLENRVGSQVDSQSATLGGSPSAADPQLTLDAQTEQLSEAATTATASLFFSLLQNILSEAQSNSSA